MARTTYATGDVSTVKLWSKKFAFEAFKGTSIGPLIGDGQDSIIRRMSELKKSAGDQITYNLFMQLTGAGKTENQTLLGNGESITNYSDALVINELMHNTNVPTSGNINDQRVMFQHQKIGRKLLAQWYARRMSVTFFNHVCGYTPANAYALGSANVYTGHNTVVAPTSSGTAADNRIIRPSGISNDESLTSAHTFSLAAINYAKEQAHTADPQIAPVMVEGEEHYVMYLHPYQVTDLQVETGSDGWQNIVINAASRGDKNPIFTGALGMYNGVVLRTSFDVTYGVHSTTGAAETDVRRAVLLGASSAAIATAEYNGEADYVFSEEKLDHGRWLDMAVKSLFGMKKVRYNSKDFGTVVVPTYAVAHSAY